MSKSLTPLTTPNTRRLFKIFKDEYPEWADNDEILEVVRATLVLCESTHPGWVICGHCHGEGWVHDHNYSGSCPICAGKKGKWNNPPQPKDDAE